jgi:hypothetical protein
MAFTDFSRYTAAVKTVLRQKANAAVPTWVRILTDVMTGQAEAISEFFDASYPVQTASAWVLDGHWGPSLNLLRNGLSDADFRLYCLVKRRLNRSWGNVDGILVILRELLPTATSITWALFSPKTWQVNVVGVPLADAAVVFEFLRKRPSPEGGGYSVGGDNAFAVAADPLVMTFSSIHGAVVVPASWSSIHGPSGSGEAGWAHAVPI